MNSPVTTSDKSHCIQQGPWAKMFTSKMPNERLKLQIHAVLRRLLAGAHATIAALTHLIVGMRGSEGDRRKEWHTRGQTALCAYHACGLNSCLQKCDPGARHLRSFDFSQTLYLLPIPKKTASWKTVIRIPNLCIKIGQTNYQKYVKCWPSLPFRNHGTSLDKFHLWSILPGRVRNRAGRKPACQSFLWACPVALDTSKSIPCVPVHSCVSNICLPQVCRKVWLTSHGGRWKRTVKDDFNSCSILENYWFFVNRWVL